jgi:hypothetical protein
MKPTSKVFHFIGKSHTTACQKQQSIIREQIVIKKKKNHRLKMCGFHATSDCIL